MKHALLHFVPLCMGAALTVAPSHAAPATEAEEAKVELLARFPAIDQGDQVAFIAARGNYDDSGRIELRLATPGGAVQRWKLEETRYDTTRTNLRTRLFPKGQRQAKRLFSTEGFRTLTPAVTCQAPDPSDDRPLPPPCRCETVSTDEILLPMAAGPWLVSYDTTQHELRVRDARCKVVFRRKVEIPKSWYCCGGAEPSDPGCQAAWDRMTVWWDTRVLLVEGTSIAGPDGCELDNLYVVVWPAQGKASVSDNWNPFRGKARR